MAAPLGDLLAEAAARHLAGRRVDLLVPVPLHRRRERDRGFNQAELLARRVARRRASPPAGGSSSAARPPLPRPSSPRPQRRPTCVTPSRWPVPERSGPPRAPGRTTCSTTGATAAACAAVSRGARAASVGLLDRRPRPVSSGGPRAGRARRPCIARGAHRYNDRPERAASDRHGSTTLLAGSAHASTRRGQRIRTDRQGLLPGRAGGHGHRRGRGQRPGRCEDARPPAQARLGPRHPGCRGRPPRARRSSSTGARSGSAR